MSFILLRQGGRNLLRGLLNGVGGVYIIQNDEARRMLSCERLRIAHRRQQRGAELISPEPRITFKYFSVGGFPADTSTTLLAAFFSTRATWRTNSSCILAFETDNDVAEAAILARDCTFEGVQLSFTRLSGHEALRRIGMRNAAAADIGGTQDAGGEELNVEQLRSLSRGLSRQSALRALREAEGDVILAAARVTEWDFTGGEHGDEESGGTPSVETQKEVLRALATLPEKCN